MTIVLTYSRSVIFVTKPSPHAVLFPLGNYSLSFGASYYIMFPYGNLEAS